MVNALKVGAANQRKAYFLPPELSPRLRIGIFSFRSLKGYGCEPPDRSVSP